MKTFNNHSNGRKFVLKKILLIFTLFAAACTNIPKIKIELVYGDPTNTFQPATPTLSDTPTQTSTITPTSTRTRVPMPTKTPTVTWSPKTTWPVSEVLVWTAQESQPDENCKLPCWWGIPPGNADFDTVLENRGRKAVNVYIYETVGIRQKVEMKFPVNKSISSVGTVTHTYEAHNGIIDSMDIDPGVLPHLRLHRVLMSYGIPDEIRINTAKFHSGGRVPFGNAIFNASQNSSILPSISRTLPFATALYYSSFGTLVVYYSDGYMQGENICSYIQQANRPHLTLWAPEEMRPFADERNQHTLGGPGGDYKPLEDVTDMTKQEFYDLFIDSNNRIGLCTPADLWEEY